jgi:hypothetical protein
MMTVTTIYLFPTDVNMLNLLLIDNRKNTERVRYIFQFSKSDKFIHIFGRVCKNIIYDNSELTSVGQKLDFFSQNTLTGTKNDTLNFINMYN